MIRNDKHREVWSKQLARLKQALAVAEARASGHAWLKQAEIDGIKSLIIDIEAELAHYDRSPRPAAQ